MSSCCQKRDELRVSQAISDLLPQDPVGFLTVSKLWVKLESI
jgi:hypothetical protein